MCSHSWEPLREASIGALWTRQLSLADVSFSPSARISTTLHPRRDPRLTEVFSSFLSRVHFF